MEPVFIVDRGFKAQLCLWAPPLPNKLTQYWCANSGTAQTWTTSLITGKVVLIIVTLECLVAVHIILTEIKEEKHSKLNDYFN